jgi:hypothetical protein
MDDDTYNEEHEDFICVCPVCGHSTEELLESTIISGQSRLAPVVRVDGKVFRIIHPWCFEEGMLGTTEFEEEA